MEDLLINILAEKGIELIGEQLLKTINPNDALNDLLNEANSIHQKLDQLIDAPFREAMLYLREGKIEIFKEKIRTAISVNENNIPARLAYVYILCDDNNYKLATEELIKLYCEFTQRKDLFHEEILAQFHSIEMDFFKTRDNLHIKYLENNCYPLRFYFFPSYFIVIWGLRKSIGISWYSPQYIICYDWEGNVIFSEKVNNCDVHFMSYRYILYNSNGKYVLYDLKYKKMNSITENDAIKIFEINISNLLCDYNFLEDEDEKVVSDICVVRKGNICKWKESSEVTVFSELSDIGCVTSTKTYTYKCGTVDLVIKR